jgi:hypothetical protein
MRASLAKTVRDPSFWKKVALATAVSYPILFISYNARNCAIGAYALLAIAL